MSIPEELMLSRSSQKDLLLTQRLQDLETRTSQEPPKRVFIQAPVRHGICKIFMQGPLREDLTRISTRSSVEDLHRTQSIFRILTQVFSGRIQAGSPLDLLRRTCTSHPRTPRVTSRSQGPAPDDGRQYFSRSSTHRDLHKITQVPLR